MTQCRICWRGRGYDPARRGMSSLSYPTVASTFAFLCRTAWALVLRMCFSTAGALTIALEHSKPVEHLIRDIAM
jgi:hypothetical protein